MPVITRGMHKRINHILHMQNLAIHLFYYTITTVKPHLNTLENRAILNRQQTRLDHLTANPPTTISRIAQLEAELVDIINLFMKNPAVDEYYHQNSDADDDIEFIDNIR